MARFVLQPCKVRAARFVPDRDAAPVELGWKELVLKLAPRTLPGSEKKLTALQVGAYIGLSRSARDGKLVNFLLLNPDRSGNIGAVLKKDPSFESRVVEVYKVEQAFWDAKTTEPDSRIVD